MQGEDRAGPQGLRVETPPRRAAARKVGESLEGWCPSSREESVRDEAGNNCISGPEPSLAAFAVPRAAVRSLAIGVTMSTPKGCDEIKRNDVLETQGTLKLFPNGNFRERSHTNNNDNKVK